MMDATHSSDMDFIDELGAGGSACGYIIQFENGKKIYHSGDTGLFSDMREVVRDIYKPEIVLIPIGDRYTMGPRDAAIAAKWIDPELVIPMHYNTFPVIQQDPIEFADRVESANPKIKVVILEPGETYKE
jgi:L-ascorbate metabolism protein UlaG (beta-lactamase superfamily)